MQKDFSKDLKGFDAVWQRVEQSKKSDRPKNAGPDRVQPPNLPRAKQLSRADRFYPGRR